jgi:hypothetical protein
MRKKPKNDDSMKATAQFSRRHFLAGGAGLAGVLFLDRGGWTRSLAAGGHPEAALLERDIAARSSASGSTLDIFNLGYPTSFVFRQAGVLAANNNNSMSYSDWLAQVSPLNGVVTKLLNEEEPISTNILSYCQQYKTQYPNKMVLEHFNGWERLPNFETTNWFAGFWLYRAGAKTLNAITPTTTVISVGTVATKKFSTMTGPAKRPDDICIAAMLPNGLPDFTQAEHVQLVSINAAAGTLTVNRAMYGSTALSFAKGAFIAPHVTRGPFTGDGLGPMVWMCNFSTMAPKDPQGHTVVDAIVSGLAPGEGIAAHYASGGDLAFTDGMLIDATSFYPPPEFHPDCNNDRKQDNGIFNGVDTFGIGIYNFLTALRTALGPNRIITVDGENVAHDGIIGFQRPDDASVNGLKLEGFPNLQDSAELQWSEALANISYYQQAYTHQPTLCFPVFKTDLFKPPVTGEGINQRFRIALAGALITGSQFTFYKDPDGQDALHCTNLEIWDELLAGTQNTPNWLGQPLGPPVHVSLTTDLLSGAGTTMSPSFAANFQGGTNMTFSNPNGGSAGAVLTVKGSPARSPKTMTFTLNNLPLTTGNDLLIQMDIMASPQPQYASTLDRRLMVSAPVSGSAKPNTQSTPIGGNWFTVLLYFRGVSPTSGAIQLTFATQGQQAVSFRNIKVYNGPDAVFRQFTKGAVFANPSLSPYTFQVSSLAPSTSFVRLTATNGTGQDPTVNDGSAIGSTLMIPAQDALIVMNA